VAGAAKRICPLCEDFYGESQRTCPAHGRELFVVERSLDPKVGTRIDGRYTVLGVLGKGGMGVVYRALQHSMEREVAIKLIPASVAADPVLVQRFQQEARGASRLNHPNIITLIDFGRTGDGELFIVMELLEGWSLRDRLSTRGRLDVPEVVSIVVQVCQAIHYAHARGVIHRDLKPENIFLLPRGPGQPDIVKVIDFGVAKMKLSSPGPNITQAGTICGTPAYMSPEQIMGEELDGRSDVYGLGCVIFEMLTGEVPFEEEKAMDVVVAHLRRPPPPLDSIVSGISPAMVELVRRTLDKRPEKRPRDAAELARLLAAVLETSVDETKTTEPALEVRIDALPARGGDVAPSPEEHSGRAAPVKAEAPRASQIPAMASFIGRRPDLEAIGALLRGGARLLTIHGPAGMGKTTISLRLLTDCFTDVSSPPFPCHGGWFCDLTEARTVGDICLAVADTLKVPLSSELIADAAIDQLGHALAARGPVLVVLDNFEQVVAHGPATVGHWIRLAPRARFIVTTREILGLLAEVVYELQPLSVPGGTTDIETSEAVQLFAERARAVRPGFEIDETNAGAVAEIVRCLDGIPLAIELAAARIGVLGPRQILERLSNRFTLLVGRRRDVKKRQATLREALEWSWDLLDPEERSALAQLSAFRGGFDLGAAEALMVLDAFPGPPSPIDLVQRLRDNALIRCVDLAQFPGELRFAFYESIRLFAEDKLEAMGDLAATHGRHSRYYLDTCTAWSREILTRGGLSARRRLGIEMENLSAVLERALEVQPPTPESASQAIGALAVLNPILAARGIVGESFERVERVMNHASDVEVEPGLLAAAHYARAEARRARGLLVQSIGDYTRARELARDAGDRSREAWCLGQLGLAAFQQGRVFDALEAIQGALEIYEGLGEPLGHGWQLGLLGTAFLFGDQLELALSYCEQAMGVLHQLEDPGFEGCIQVTLAKVLHEQGRFTESFAAFEGALEKLRVAEVRIFEATAVLGLARLAWEQGRIDPALELHERACNLAREMGHQVLTGMVLGGLGALEADLGDVEGATCRFLEAEPLLHADAGKTCTATVTVHWGHLDVALARLARERRDEKTAADHVAAARDRIAVVNRADPPGADHPEGLPPVTMRSDDARFAVRMLERALAGM
jgi:serine/threonine protein kinase/predicted ATPase